MYTSRREIVTTRNAVIHQTSTESDEQEETVPMSNHESTQIQSEMSEQNDKTDRTADISTESEHAESVRPTRQLKKPAYLHDYTLSTVG